MQLLTVGNMYPPHHQGGYEVVWRSFAEHARQAGHGVTVLTTTHREPGIRAAADHDVLRELEWYWEDHAFPPRGVRARLAIERHNREVLGRVLDERAPDVVLWWAMGGMSLSLIGQVAQRRIPAVGIVHDLWPAYGPLVDQWTGSRLARIAGPLLRLPRRLDPCGVGAWTFNSRYTMEAALVQKGWTGLRTQVDHPGVDRERMAPRPAGEWEWRLACIGRIDERKGLVHAVKALERLPDKATLTITGGGNGFYRQELVAMASAPGLSNRVRLREPRQDIAAAYAEADAILFPVTWDEPFGLVPLEAMAIGRPVVATATGGAREYLRHEDNALLVEPGDDGAIAAAVMRLACEPGLRERLVKGGARTAAALSAERFDSAVLELALSVAGDRLPRRG